MYNHFRGQLVFKNAERVVLDVGGVGYELSVAANVAGRLPALGKEARLLAHLVVREDELRLYGFFDDAEREMFRTLIGLSGIGPATALHALSAISPADFAQAVQRQDAGAFKRVKGIGEKTAKRIILELKGAKTRLYADGDGGVGVDPAEPSVSGEGASLSLRGISADAALALQGLGIPEREAEDRIARIVPTRSDWTLEDLIRAALRN